MSLELEQLQLPAGFKLGCVAASSDRVVALEYGTVNRAVTSLDGENWTVTNLQYEQNAHWSAVAWGGGRFVAVNGWSGTSAVATSPDGFSWTVHTTALPSLSYWNVRGLVYDGTRFVLAAASPNGIAVSTNGESWTYTALPFEPSGLVYADGMYVTWGWYAIRTSTDVVTWTTYTTTSFSPRSVAWFKGAWYVTDYGRLFTTSDFVNFTRQYGAGFGGFLTGAKLGSDVYAASGADIVRISTDGTVTAVKPEADTQSLGGSSAGGGKAVFLARKRGTNHIYSYVSADGNVWGEHYVSTYADYRGGAYFNGAHLRLRFNYNEVLRSVDGATWDTFYLPISASWAVAPIVAGGVVCAIAQNGTVISSTDGIAWTQRATVPVGGYNWSIYAACFAAGYFFAYDSNADQLYRSTDLNSWSAVYSDSTISRIHGAFGYLVAIAGTGDSQNVGFSTDGVNWEWHPITARSASVLYAGEDELFITGSGAFMRMAAPVAPEVSQTYPFVGWGGLYATANALYLYDAAAFNRSADGVVWESELIPVDVQVLYENATEFLGAGYWFQRESIDYFRQKLPFAPFWTGNINCTEVQA